MTPEEVLGKERDKGYYTLAYLVPQISDERLLDATQKALNHYIQTRFGNIADLGAYIDALSEAMCNTFIVYFGITMTDQDRETFLGKSAYTDMDAFRENASISQKKMLVRAILDKYAVRKVVRW